MRAKASILIIAISTLAGCSNSPSSSDIDRALTTAVAGCQNVEVTNIKKTNGYDSEGLYRVEYEYELKLKNKAGLAKLSEAWTEEKRRDVEYKSKREAYENQVRKLESDITNIRATLQSKVPIIEWRNQMSEAERETFYEAQKLREDEQSAATEGSRKELEALKRAWDDARSNFPRANVYSNEDDTIYNFLSQGCTQAGWKYAKGLLTAHVKAVNQANARVPNDMPKDLGAAFQEQSAEMTGSMTMRKTENGWLPVSAG